jgi:hypothetical protein
MIPRSIILPLARISAVRFLHRFCTIVAPGNRIQNFTVWCSVKFRQNHKPLLGNGLLGKLSFEERILVKKR